MNKKPAQTKRSSQPQGIVIPESELSFSFSRSGGPGGQNVNKVETKVAVSFDFMSSKVLSWEAKGRLGRHPLVVQNLNSEGAIVVISQAHRSQSLNREDAVAKLHELVRQALRPTRKRIPTKKTKGSERKRLSTKRERSEAKATRRSIKPYLDE